MDGVTKNSNYEDQSEKDLTHWLTLNRLKGFGPKKIAALIEHFGNPEQIFNSSIPDLKKAGLKSPAIDQIKNIGLKQIEADLTWLKGRSHHHIITFDDRRYPSLLKELTDPPVVLYVSGDPDLLSVPQLAIVGSRSATQGGRALAHEFARLLTRSGLIVTSGMALGIDAAAHEGALEVSGKTIAVLGTGPDRIYPARHLKLAEQIVDSGTIVTEFAPGTTPRKENFPRRNRVISGLTLGTLVVEAAQQSGSLITARFALEQGREVFAIPGSIKNPQARGCHALIREGAKLVESVEDIIEDLGPLCATLLQDISIDKVAAETGPLLQDKHKPVIENMGYDPVSVDELVKRSGLTASDVSAILLSLELEGYVSSQVGGMYVRNK